MVKSTITESLKDRHAKINSNWSYSRNWRVRTMLSYTVSKRLKGILLIKRGIVVPCSWKHYFLDVPFMLARATNIRYMKIHIYGKTQYFNFVSRKVMKIHICRFCTCQRWRSALRKTTTSISARQPTLSILWQGPMSTFTFYDIHSQLSKY